MLEAEKRLIRADKFTILDSGIFPNIVMDLEDLVLEIVHTESYPTAMIFAARVYDALQIEVVKKLQDRPSQLDENYTEAITRAFPIGYELIEYLEEKPNPSNQAQIVVAYNIMGLMAKSIDDVENSVELHKQSILEANISDSKIIEQPIPFGLINKIQFRSFKSLVKLSEYLPESVAYALLSEKIMLQAGMNGAYFKKMKDNQEYALRRAKKLDNFEEVKTKFESLPVQELADIVYKT